MTESLEPEILRALEQAGLRPRSFARISNIRSPEIDRSAYRVEHSGGTVKVRRLEDEATASRLVALRDGLPDAFVPVLFRCGRVLLEEWIEGEALSDPPAPDRLAEAGVLLGALHARSTLGSSRLHEVRGTGGHLLTAERSLRHVVAAGALGKDEAASLARVMRELDPRHAIHGLVHFDFCGENMLIDVHGRLRVVDNERLRVDALGFDLARTWYRWALPEPDWEHFCSAYAASVPFSDPQETLRFWQIVAVARAAALRLRAFPERADVTIMRLRAIVSMVTS
jgi:hypothetical protein